MEKSGYDPPVSFGGLLRDFRLAAGMSQEALAERAGLSAGGISVLERGVRRAPYRDTVELLANGLGLSSADRMRLELAATSTPQPRRRRTPKSPDAFERAGHNLPIELTSFIGREAEIAQLRSLLSTSRLVTIVGVGGVGKTRMALRIAEAVVGTVDGGVWFVDLAPISDGSTLAVTVANAVDVRHASESMALQALTEFVSQSEPLLVLDNCEHVLADVARVCEELLRASPRLRIIATSREPLKARGERVYRLPTLAAADAVELFVSRAQAVDSMLAPSESVKRAIADLCRRLDGIPLAIELAAARSGTMPLVTLAENLDRRLNLLTDRGRGGVARHQTLRTLIDWSYNLLDPGGQRTFERLSIFAGGTTLAIATRVCGDDPPEPEAMLEILSSLVDKSLVVPDFDHEEPRYTLLESMRQYGREQLTQRGDYDATARRHAAALVDLAETYEATWEMAPAPNWHALLEVEMENWRAVLEWALAARNDVLLGQRLVVALHHAWVMMFGAADAPRWLQAATELSNESTPPQIVAQLTYLQAKLAQRAGEMQAPLDLAQRALATFRELGDVRRAVSAQRIIADALQRLGRLTEAESILNEAFETALASGYRWRAAFILQSLGRLSAVAGRQNEARNRFRRSLDMLTELGDEEGVAIAASNLAEAEFQAGDAAMALQLAEEALSRRRGFWSLLGSIPNMAAYLIALDRFDEAIAHAREVLRITSNLQRHADFLWALQRIAAASVLRLEPSGENALKTYRYAARVLGYVDAQLTASGALREFTEQQEYDRLVSRLRELLDEGEISRNAAAGAALTRPSAIDLAETLAPID